MKTYNAKKRISAQLKKEIKSIIDMHDKYKRAYFWNTGVNANQRRSRESLFNENYPPFKIETSKGLIEVIPYYSESCKNVYYSLGIFLDDQKKNITLLKKLIK